MNPLHRSFIERAVTKNKQLKEAVKYAATTNPRLVSARMLPPTFDSTGGDMTVERPTRNYGANRNTMVGLEHSSKLDPTLIPRTAALLGSLDMAGPKKSQPTDPKELIGIVQGRMQDNLNFTLNRHRGESQKEIDKRSPQWYSASSKMNKGFAKNEGVREDTAHAVTASLSPQTAWPINTSMSERIIHTYKQKSHHPFSPKMGSFVDKILATPTADNKESNLQKHMSEIRGRGYHELPTMEHKAAWVRAYDEAHHNQSYREPLPDGGFSKDFMKNQDGKDTKMQWGSLENIGKALSVLESEDKMKSDKSHTEAHHLGVISAAVGDKPKVRSFYNNLSQPDAPPTAAGEMPDVTADIHTSADAYGRADLTSMLHTNKKMKSERPEFSRDFGGMVMGGAPGSKKSGSIGLYPIVAQAVTNVGKQRDLRGNQTQSLGWSDRQVDSRMVQASPAASKQVRDMHTAMHTGELSHPEFLKHYGSLIGSLPPKELSWIGTPANDISTSFQDISKSNRVITEHTKWITNWVSSRLRQKYLIN
jgi:hypothetical protein